MPWTRWETGCSGKIGTERPHAASHVPHSHKIAEDPPMKISEYDETRATARLPNVDIEILHRRPWEGNEEQLVVMLRAVPSFEAVGRWLEASNLLLVWTRMMEAAWSPWARAHHGPLSKRQTTIPARF